MSGSSQSYYGASPSVTKERWLKHAVHKLSKGYMLIVNSERRVANFYKGYGDFESCSYQTARALISGEFVESDGEDPMGIIYKLKSDTDVAIQPSVEEDEADSLDTDSIDTDSSIDDEPDLDEQLENTEGPDLAFDEE